MPESRSFVLLPNQPAVMQKNASHSVSLSFEQLLQNPHYLGGNFRTQMCGKYQLLLSSNDEAESNPLATRFRASHCKDLTDEVKGTCIVVGTNDKGQISGLSTEDAKEVDKQLKTLYHGQPKASKKTKEPGDVKPRSAEYSFKLDFKRQKREAHAVTQKDVKAPQKKTLLPREEVEAAANDAWDKASDEEKAKWEKAYQDELKLYNDKHPQKPTRARHAFNFFKKEKGMNTDENWNDKTDDEKLVYEKRAKDDVTRYENDLKKYRAQCEQLGMDAGVKYAEDELNKLEKRRSGKKSTKKRKVTEPEPSSDME